MLKGEVFSRQLFENQIFALFINTFLNGKNGVSNNYKNSMAVTANGSNVTINSGAVCIQGRFLTEDSSTTLSAGTDTAFCKLVIEINLDNINTESEFTQASYKVIKNLSTYPELIQTNIVKNNSGIYQYELARFKTTTNGITDFQDMRTFLDFESIYDEVQEHIRAIDDGTLWLLKSGGTMTGVLNAEAGVVGNVTGNVSGSSSSCSGTATAAITAFNCSGNSNTATTLQTSRNINGTSFNGSESITTEKWGKSRTLSLTGAVTGSASIDGSANISISTSQSEYSTRISLSGANSSGNLEVKRSGNIVTLRAVVSISANSMSDITHTLSGFPSWARTSASSGSVIANGSDVSGYGQGSDGYEIAIGGYMSIIKNSSTSYAIDALVVNKSSSSATVRMNASYIVD